MEGQHLKGRFHFRPFQPWNVRLLVSHASYPFISKILATCGTYTKLKLPLKIHCNAEWMISASARANDNIIGGKEKSTNWTWNHKNVLGAFLVDLRFIDGQE
jgi:hypothetical protein